MGYGYCERMQWQKRAVDDRPRTAAGDKPPPHGPAVSSA